MHVSCITCRSALNGCQEQAHMPMYHPTPSQARLATQLTEEEQIRIAQRIGLIQHLPKGVYDGGQDGSEKKIREWAFLVVVFTQELWALSFGAYADLPLKALTVWRHVAKYLSSNVGACFSPCSFIWSEMKSLIHTFLTKLNQLVILFTYHTYCIFGSEVLNTQMQLIFVFSDAWSVCWTLFTEILSDSCLACTSTTWTV